ncbi:MAG: fibronectin type III domain-containing protein, partial [Myxococcota bacterium]
NASRLDNFVFDIGLMPVARLTLDRLWVDFGGGLPAAEILREHLESLGREVTGRVPGQPRAKIAIVDGDGTIFSDPSTIPLPDITEVDAFGELLPETIRLLGDGSLFAEEFEWMVEAIGSGCPASPDLMGSTSAQATLIVDSSPCTFSASLEVHSTASSDLETVTIVADRLPEIPDPATPFQAPLDTYLPGDDFLEIDLLGRITSNIDGDGGLIGVILDDPDITPNSLVSLIGDGTQAGAQVEFDLGSRLAGVTAQLFEYKIVDEDGSLSLEPGIVQVDIPEIRPENLRISGSPTETGAQLEWDTAAGFTASRYLVQRADFPGLLDSDFDVEFITTNTTPPIISFSDNTLSTGQIYAYRVFTELDDGPFTERSRASDILNLSTTVGVPSLSEIAGGKTSSQIQLNMLAAADSSPDSFELYQAGEGLPLAILSPPLANFIVTGLAQNSSYSFELAQTLNSIQSARSMPPVAVVTRAAPPTNLAGVPMAGSTTSLSLFWDPPLGGITPAVYEITPVSSTGSLISVSATELTVTNLTPDALHAYRVASVGTAGLSDPTIDISIRTNVSFATNIAPRRTSGNGFNVFCAGCHSAVVWESYIRNNTEGCLTNDLNLGDCSPVMTGFMITSEMRELLLRWNAQGELD